MSRIGMFLLFVAPLSLAAGQPTKALPKPVADTARADVLRLMAEMERLQEDVVAQPGVAKGPPLYPLTQDALTELGRLDGLLRKDVSQEVLLKHFDGVDARLQALIAAVRKTTANGQTLQRDADHINRANEELYFTLATGSTGRAGQVTARQVHGLTDAARDLEKTARFALDKSGTDRAVLIDNAATLAVAAGRFEKSLEDKADLKQRQADFAAVDRAWTRVVHDLGLLKPAENAHLLHSAARVDRLHEHLYRLLEIKGKRPSLSVQS
jgi:hypothetical protein